MRRVVVAALLSAYFSLPALAQDKPAETSSSGSAPDRWDGFYAGLNFGYSDSPGNGIDFNKWNTGTTPGLIGQSVRASRTEAIPAGLNTDPRGLFGGIQAGRNWRIYPEWVAGLEADFDLSSVDRKSSRSGFHQNAPFPPLLAFSANADVSGKQDVRWFSTLRGRMGMLATDDLLLYGTAGLTYSRLHASSKLSETVCTPACNLQGSASETDTKMGWTAGAGFEWAMDRNLSIKAEYLYLHLGSVTYRDSLTRFGLVSIINMKTDANFNTNIFRVGLNYRFGN